ncbi:DUF724 domain-containing protein 3-like, partial [Asparagus officinalis]|uniref:DUF724 domain-containing protein 3-like n=1 Tax=Asparagus officinalis TaxID=4686 RepID=UPI00098E315E
MAKSPATFAAGEKVEVICQDEGFKGSLYEARIVSIPKSELYLIEYETLMDDTDPEKHLQETVSCVHVRPRPCPPALSSFEIGEKVDALYNDGWWVGEISKVLEGGKRYGVRFPDSEDDDMEELEFGLDQIRVHMDWIDGQWISPNVTVKKFLGVEIRKGAMVEVRSDDEGLDGAWYTASIVGSNGEKFLVEYQNLRTDNEAELLRETVDSLHVRPIPPETPVDHKFNILEEIDAFYNDGWWVGVICKVLMGQRYMVYFKPWNEEMEFAHSDLRLHHEWIDGRWQRASQTCRKQDLSSSHSPLAVCWSDFCAAGVFGNTIKIGMVKELYTLGSGFRHLPLRSSKLQSSGSPHPHTIHLTDSVLSSDYCVMTWLSTARKPQILGRCSPEFFGEVKGLIERTGRCIILSVADESDGCCGYRRTLRALTFMDQSGHFSIDGKPRSV